MKEVIYLVVSQNKVERMTKRLPDLYRGEIPVKLTLNVPKEAFNPPTLDQEVYVEDWRQGIDLEDVEFRQSIITKEEAEVIRQTRLEKMKTVLEAQGYKIEKPEEE
jgi:hypothetical protein